MVSPAIRVGARAIRPQSTEKDYILSTSNIKCQSCLKPKAEVHPYKSTLTGQQLLMCKSCITSKFEPRWLVVLHGHQFGFASVAHLLAPVQKYCGDPIIGADFVQVPRKK